MLLLIMLLLLLVLLERRHGKLLLRRKVLRPRRRRHTVADGALDALRPVCEHEGDVTPGTDEVADLIRLEGVEERER